jgi:hypothetical protein
MTEIEFITLSAIAKIKEPVKIKQLKAVLAKENPPAKQRTKLIHGVEVPDISFVPRKEEHFYHPILDNTLYKPSTYHGYGIDAFRVKYGLCYPHTEEGKQAAILHAKAMLGIKD